MELGSICSYITNVVIDYFYAMPYAYPRQDKTRQDKTRQDKTRQDKTRQTNYGLKAKSIVKPFPKDFEEVGKQPALKVPHRILIFGLLFLFTLGLVFSNQAHSPPQVLAASNQTQENQNKNLIEKVWCFLTSCDERSSSTNKQKKDSGQNQNDNKETETSSEILRSAQNDKDGNQNIQAVLGLSTEDLEKSLSDLDGKVDLLFSTQQQSGNLIKNPSFEANNSGQPTFWSFTNESVEKNTFVNNPKVRSGNNALRIEPKDNKTTFGIYQPSISTTFGRPYTLSLYISNQTGETITLKLGFWDRSGNKRVGGKEFSVPNNTATSSVTVGTTGFSKYSYTLNPNSDISIGRDYYPMIEIGNAKSGNIYIDDVSLTDNSGLGLFESKTTTASIGGGSVIIDDNANIYPVTSGTGSLGISNNKFTALYLSKASIDKDGNLSIGGNADVDGTLTVDGNSTLSGTLGVTGASTLSSTLTVSGVTTLNGSITLGDATSDTITPTGRFAGSIVPSADATYDLGTSSLQFRNMYLSGTVTSGGNQTISNTNPTLTFEDTTSSEDDWNINVDSNTFRIRNTTDGINYLSIDGSGNVTLTSGTSLTASSLSTLTTASSLTLSGATSLNTSLTNMTIVDNAIIGLGASAGRIEFDDQSTDEVNILSANVGIGTQTPGALLDVAGIAFFGTSSDGVNIASADGHTIQSRGTNANLGLTAVGSGHVALNYYGGTGGTVFYNGANSRVASVNSSGHLTLGNATDAASNTSGAYIDQNGAKTAADYGVYLANTSTSSTNSINKYGLYITSTGTWNGTSAINYGLYVDTPTGGTSNYAAVFAGGNVGIGTAAPGVTLDVSGKTRQNLAVLTNSGGPVSSLVTNTLAIGDDGSQFNIWDNIGGRGFRFYDNVNARSPWVVSAAGQADFGLSGSTGSPGENAFLIRAGSTLTTSEGRILLLYNNTFTASANNNAFATFKIQSQVMATGTFTGLTAYGSYIDASSWTKTGTGTIDNTYGLRVVGATIGTNNYAAVFTGGNLGIGTVSPSKLLDVQGEAQINLASTQTSVALCGSHTAGSGASVSDVTIVDCTGTPAADYAEMYPVTKGVVYGEIVSTSKELVEIDFVTQDSDGSTETQKKKISKLVKSNVPYQQNIIGITSKNYGDFSSVGHNSVKKEDNPMPVALNGRVPVKVSSSSEPIEPGDFLTSSTEVGKAMKATKTGQMIGKALEAWDKNSGKDTVMVFVNITYADPNYVNPLAGLIIDENGNLVNTTELTANEVDKTKNSDISKTTEKSNKDNLGGNALTEGIEIASGSGSLEIKKELNLFEKLIAKAQVIFENTVTFLGSVIFKGDVTFLGKATFKQVIVDDKDAAGVAVVLKDNDNVEIKFEKEYAASPIINATIYNLEGADNKDDEKINKILSSDIKYAIVKVSTKGFTIKLNRKAPEDIQFSWTALATKDINKTVSKQVENQTTKTEQVNSSPTPTSSASPSPTPNVSPIPSPSPTPTSDNSKKIKVLENDLGFLRVRKEPKVDSEEIAQVKPDQIFVVLDNQYGFFKIEYESGKTGWVSSTYVKED